MSRPDKCKWCGSHEIDDDDTTTDIVFACGSTRRFFSDICFQSVPCAEILDLRNRIADALAALAAIERHEADSDLEFERVSEHGEWVLFEDLKPVVSILQGNSPEIPDGSAKQESEK